MKMSADSSFGVKTEITYHSCKWLIENGIHLYSTFILKRELYPSKRH